MKNLWEKLVAYSKSDYYPFHTPGHKRFSAEIVLPCCKSFPGENESVCCKSFPGEDESVCCKSFPEEGTPVCHKYFQEKKKDFCNKSIPREDTISHDKDLEYIYKYDITEIEGFDNLHDAKGLLLELQQKAAHIYHADESFFLINGSTGGILSAVSAVARDGKKLLMARNCHKSVYNAVALNRLQAEYLYPEVIEDFAVQGEITAGQVRQHLEGRRDICGVVITSPTYDGIISDIREIAKAVHDCHIPLIVDEAHGAHFALSEEAPESAVQCGADIVINSVHKTLPAMTQTALLHVQGSLVDREKLKNYLRIYQSSSPSYILMASIDCCMDFIVKEGPERYKRLLALRKKIEQAAADFSRIRLMSPGKGWDVMKGQSAGKRRDVGKLVISVRETGMTGWELYRILLEKYHLQMEMAAPTYVLGILTVMDTEEGVERLVDALAGIDRELCQRTGENAEVGKKQKGDSMYSTRPPVAALTIYEAQQREKKWVFPGEAVGKISGEFLFFYPPGIPLLAPGEVISEELVGKIKQCRENNGYMTGLSECGKIRVLS